MQPATSTGVELALWSTIFAAAGLTELNGFSRVSYLTYVLWATFVARITANWAYEMEMSDEIETGRINIVLLRPISFYEYYLSQFMGYKLWTIPFSLGFPLLASAIFPTTVIWSRLVPMLVLILYYLIFVHTIAFCIACFGFFITRVKGITVAKNMSLWVLTGELFPLDLVPEPMKTWAVQSPFASGVYIPVGFLSGRFGWDQYWMAFVSVTGGLVITGMFSVVIWRRGLREYTGTGA
jgi:ABC-2 type transport system permease protein